MSRIMAMLTPSWRVLIWKEMRQLRGAVFTAAVAGLLLFLWMFIPYGEFSQWTSMIRESLVFWYLGIFVVIGFLFAVELFAGENERGTVGLLKNLPIKPQRYALGKLGVGLVSLTAVMLVVYAILWFQHVFLIRIEYKPPFSEVLWPSFGFVAAVWVFLITSVAAAWTRNMLATGLIALPVSALILLWLPQALLGGHFWANSESTFWKGLGESLFFVPLTDGLWFAPDLKRSADGWIISTGAWLWNFAAWAACVWLVSLRAERWIRPSVGKKHLVMTDDELTSKNKTGKLPQAQWKSLFWLAARQGYGVWVWLLVSALSLPLLLPTVLQTSKLGMFAPFYYNVIVLSVLMAIGSGSIFGNEQASQRLSYYQQHSVSGRKFWWSRMTLWLGIILVAVGATILIHFLLLLTAFPSFDVKKMISSENDYNVLGMQWLFRRLGEFFWLAIVLLAVGQFCSLVFRRAITAVCISAMLGLILSFWAISIALLGESLAWSLLPWGLLLLFTGWYVAPKWLNGTWSLRWRVLTVTALSIAFLIQFSVFASKRRYEFASPPTPEVVRKRMDAVSPDFLKVFQMALLYDDGERPENQDESGDTPLHQLGWGAVDTVNDRWSTHKDAVLAYLSKNRDTIERLKTALSAIDQRIDWPDEGPPSFWSALVLNQINALDWEAQRLLAEGELKESLDCMLLQTKLFPMLSPTTSTYVFERFVARMIRWAEHPDQTAELVFEAINWSYFEPAILGYPRLRFGTPSAWYSFVQKDESWTWHKNANENALLKFLDFETERRHRFILQETSHALPGYLGLEKSGILALRGSWIPFVYHFSTKSADSWEFADKERTNWRNNSFQELKKHRLLNTVLWGYLNTRLYLQSQFLQTGRFTEIDNHQRSQHQNMFYWLNLTRYDDNYYPLGDSFEIEYPPVSSLKIIDSEIRPAKQGETVTTIPWATIPPDTPYQLLPFPQRELRAQDLLGREQQAWYGLIDYRLRPNRPIEPGEEAKEKATDEPDQTEAESPPDAGVKTEQSTDDD
jgi:hypothetical protein